MTSSTTSLLDWILNLLRDPDARADFQADPRAYAKDNGFENLSSSDVYDALCLIGDNQSASYDYRGGGDHFPPPPHPSHRGDGDGDAARYLNNYITNNYTSIDDRDTNVDSSIHQKIDTDGGDFDQTIDNDPVIASGDGSVAAGGDIRDSTLTTGDGNVVGDNNQAVTGDDNTTAFGTGDATNASFDDARFGEGSAVSLGGNADGSSTDNDTTTSVRGGDGATSVNAAGADGNADLSANQSETDNSTDSNFDNHSSTDSHNDLNSHNQADISDDHSTSLDV